MFTLEVGGRHIAVTKGSEGEPHAAFATNECKRSLRVKTTDGIPLWNGTDSFRIRDATPGEVPAFVRRETQDG